jgi:DNA repair exonuclease SbcCD ATPase subunit
MNEQTCAGCDVFREAIRQLESAMTRAEARVTAAEQERDKKDKIIEVMGAALQQAEETEIKLREQFAKLKAKLKAAEARVTALAQREAEKDKLLTRVREWALDGSHWSNVIAAALAPSTPSPWCCNGFHERKSCDWCGEHPPYVQGVPMCPACGGYAIEAVRVRPSTPSPDA